MTLIVAEYECPEHGRFEITVERGANGDAPNTAACPRRVVHGGASVEFPPGDVIPDAVLRRLNERGEIETGCSDGYHSPWVISAPVGRVKAGEVIRGKVAEYPSEHNVMDTRPLADGMPMSEFKARRAKVHGEVAVAKMRKLTGRTGKVMR